MKLPRLGVLAALACMSGAFAQDIWSVANLTTCGLSCLEVTVPKVHCALLDFTCQCKSSALQKLMTTCMIENCTLHDELVIAKVEASTCGLPHPDRSAEPIILAAAVYGITTLLIVLRLISKIWVSKTMGPDDWIVIFAQTILIISVYFTIKMSQLGFGKHLWDLQDGDLLLILKDFYIAENAYVVSITLTKISVLFLYLRLFEQEPWFRYAAYVSITTIATSTVIISFLTIFACHPVQFFWNRDIKGGTCIDIKAVAYAGGAMSIVHDLVIVVLPLPVLARLNMSPRKKVGIMFMIILGSLGCIVSMIRLKSLISFSNSNDPSWDNVDAVIWTVLELAAAMICASLPALRLLFIRLFHKAKPPSNSATPHRNPESRSQLKPWDFGRNPQSSAGFIELARTESDREIPPRVPEKDVQIIVGIKRTGVYRER